MKKISVEPTTKTEFSIQKLNSAAPFSEDSLRLAHHRILIIEEAKGILNIDHHTIQLAAHQVLLLAKNQVISKSNTCKMTAYEVIFSDFFWEKAPQSASNCKSVLFDQKSNNQQLPLSKAEFLEINNLLGILEIEFQKTSYTNQSDVLAAYLKIIMIKIANINYSLEDRYNNSDKTIYNAFHEMVSEKYQTVREVNEYCGYLHISHRQLHDICKRQTGLSPKKIINAMLLNESKRQLQFSATPIKEIALQLNFATYEQFSHFFKKETGHAPLSYRLQSTNSDS